VNFNHTLCVEDIRNKETFMAKLRNKVIGFDGVYPGDYKLRTDLAVAFIATGLIKHTGWGDTCVSLHPIVIHRERYHRDDKFKLTNVDWNRVKEETQ
jgi:hypothetical protein